MRHNPDLHRRGSIRLPAYDYLSAAAYFVTICTHAREPLFGAVNPDGEMAINRLGTIVQACWENLLHTIMNLFDWTNS